MAERQPYIVTVAPNGARRSKADLPQLPISPEEIAMTALHSLEAGAAMIHLHVRDEAGLHTLAAKYYEPVLQRVSKQVEDNMLVQVTSESAGLFDRHQQMEAMRALSAESISVAVRELVPDETARDDAARFFEDMTGRGVLLQYILYTPKEVDYYHELIDLGVIPRPKNLVLFVLGHYGGTDSDATTLAAYTERNRSNSPWMCCAFGARELRVMREAAELGGHARVGFENNTKLPSGSPAMSNSQLVALNAQHAVRAGRPLANAAWIRRLNRLLLVTEGEWENPA